LARILAADLAQHQSRVAAGHGGRRDNFRVSAGLKRSEAAATQGSCQGANLARGAEYEQLRGVDVPSLLARADEVIE